MTEKTSDKYLLKSPSLLQEPKSMLHCKAPKIKILAKFFKYDSKYLTAVFFETGAMSTPTKSQNVTNCGSGGSFQS